MLKIVVWGCVLAAVAVTLKIKLDTPQGPQPLARAIVSTICNSSEARWRCPNRGESPATSPSCRSVLLAGA
jgi:hypothetical protein